MPWEQGNPPSGGIFSKSGAAMISQLLDLVDNRRALLGYTGVTWDHVGAAPTQATFYEFPNSRRVLGDLLEQIQTEIKFSRSFSSTVSPFGATAITVAFTDSDWSTYTGPTINSALDGTDTRDWLAMIVNIREVLEALIYVKVDGARVGIVANLVGRYDIRSFPPTALEDFPADGEHPRLSNSNIATYPVNEFEGGLFNPGFVQTLALHWVDSTPFEYRWYYSLIRKIWKIWSLDWATILSNVPAFGTETVETSVDNLRVFPGGNIFIRVTHTITSPGTEGDKHLTIPAGIKIQHRVWASTEARWLVGNNQFIDHTDLDPELLLDEWDLEYTTDFSIPFLETFFLVDVVGDVDDFLMSSTPVYLETGLGEEMTDASRNPVNWRTKAARVPNVNERLEVVEDVDWLIASDSHEVIGTADFCFTSPLPIS